MSRLENDYFDVLVIGGGATGSGEASCHERKLRSHLPWHCITPLCGARPALPPRATSSPLLPRAHASLPGVALDAASRGKLRDEKRFAPSKHCDALLHPLDPVPGLKVALVEREDFCSGTSSRSTKLIHGGGASTAASIDELPQRLRCRSQRRPLTYPFLPSTAVRYLEKAVKELDIEQVKGKRDDRRRRRVS